MSTTSPDMSAEPSAPEKYTYGYCEDGAVCNTRGRAGFQVKARWRYRGKTYCNACFKRMAEETR